MGIKNGMTIQFNENFPASRIHDLDVDIRKVKQLYGKKIELKGNGASVILEDGRVMIKGIGYFPQEIFVEAEPDVDDTYCLVIMTKDCVGAYTHYDDVIEHEVDAVGLYIACDDGQEHFHPWSFDGGIERITKKDSYEW